jgi:hypothetical protein
VRDIAKRNLTELKPFPWGTFGEPDVVIDGVLVKGS